MISPQQGTALLVRLRHASALELSDTLQALLACPDVLDQVPIVESRIDAGAYVTDEPLASLIVQTRSSGLYEKVRERLFKNDWTLVKLFKSQYPDPEIEKKLRARLYETALDDCNSVRTSIADAMREVGSEEALPTLEAILFDLEPSAKIAQVFSGG